MSQTQQNLPGVIPIFPLSGALLLPGGRLPLHIFEPRYLAMVKDALAGNKVIGMIQPRENERDSNGPPELFDYGCLGRIIDEKEGERGTMEIVLLGTSRFRVLKELSVPTPYRQVMADYGEFKSDVGAPSTIAAELRKSLLDDVARYLETRGLSLDQRALDTLGDEELVTALCMMAPFEPAEKQVLLECTDLTQMVDTLIMLISFAVAETPANQQPLRH